MSLFDSTYEKWLSDQVEGETNRRRRELLHQGLGHGTVAFLRAIWFPVFGNLDHLYPEYEVRDFNNGYRYLDLAYMPGSAKGCIEIHGFRSHARNIEASRFKDLCMKQALLVLDDWLFLPVAYLSIRDDPGVCKQLVLSFAGKLLSTDAPAKLSWAEAETIRFARRIMRPFDSCELATHLRRTERHTRSILLELIRKKHLVVASGKQRYRTFQLAGVEQPRQLSDQ